MASKLLHAIVLDSVKKLIPYIFSGLLDHFKIMVAKFRPQITLATRTMTAAQTTVGVKRV